MWCLDAGIPYSISVAAVNSKGPGNLTSTIIFAKELGKSMSNKLFT